MIILGRRPLISRNGSYAYWKRIMNPVAIMKIAIRSAIIFPAQL
jgi:hypothetical protein